MGSLFRGNLELDPGSELKSICLDSDSLTVDGLANIDMQVVPTMILKVNVRTELSEKKTAPSTTEPATTGLVPSKMSTGLMDASGEDANKDKRELSIYTNMEICYPPHVVLEPISKSKSSRFAIDIIQKDMAAGVTWTKPLKEAIQFAMVAGSRGAVIPKGHGAVIPLPHSIANACTMKLKKLEARKNQAKRQKRSTGDKVDKKTRGSLSFSKGFLSDRKGKKQRLRERAEKVVQAALLSAASIATNAAEAACIAAAAAKKASKKKKKKFRSLMADLMSPDESGSTETQRQCLAKSNPKIEFSKLDRI